VYPREVLVLCTLYNQPMRPNAIHPIFHQLYSPSVATKLVGSNKFSLLESSLTYICEWNWHLHIVQTVMLIWTPFSGRARYRSNRPASFLSPLSLKNISHCGAHPSRVAAVFLAARLPHLAPRSIPCHAPSVTAPHCCAP
jgi:hypothetical protein